ncbi:MAG: TlpA family protein disulfide reductase [Nitrospirae bacterium]|nr:TlpA family protein disulfide reductase [Nitrospirota bacterium]
MRLFATTIIMLALAVFSASASAAERIPAADFALQDMSGKTVRLSDFSGKVVLLNFWATWCRECVDELPELESLHLKFKDKGLAVIAISIDRKAATVADYLLKKPLPFPVPVDSRGEVFIKSYTVFGVPATFLIARDGTIADRLLGRQSMTSGSFMRRIENLLEEGAKR